MIYFFLLAVDFPRLAELQTRDRDCSILIVRLVPEVSFVSSSLDPDPPTPPPRRMRDEQAADLTTQLTLRHCLLARTEIFIYLQYSAK